jgi:hypothetical protein
MSTIADIIEESNMRTRAIEDILVIIEEIREDLKELKEMIHSQKSLEVIDKQ